MEKKSKALLFTDIKGSDVQLFQGPELNIENFDPMDHPVIRNTKYSPCADRVITCKAIVVNGQRACSLFFSNGEVYDAGIGFRTTKDIIYTCWIKERYQRLRRY